LTTTGSHFSKFLFQLQPQLKLPGNISVIIPYTKPEVKQVVKQFCSQFYSGNAKRFLILGINPGRFGAGITGIPFTDPVALETNCGIKNSFDKKQELSSRFVYELIAAFGGPGKFYDKFLLSAACPLGFLHGFKNYNYYDSATLLKASSDFIKHSLQQHAQFNIHNSVIISFGKKNASCLEAFNRDLKLFGKVVTLEHPRYIMQYKLKSKGRYIDQYCDLLAML
jgi:Domain of unknown function (DUF4918)